MTTPSTASSLSISRFRFLDFREQSKERGASARAADDALNPHLQEVHGFANRSGLSGQESEFLVGLLDDSGLVRIFGLDLVEELCRFGGILVAIMFS